MNLLNQFKFQFIILNRNKLIAISIAVTLLYAGIFYIFRDTPATEGILTLLIYNDPAVIGMFFVGLSIIIEKNTNVLAALFITPISIDNYLLTRIISLSILGAACSLFMAIFALGLNFNIGYFLLGTFSTCLIFSICGVFVLGETTEFLTFMVKSIPLLFILSVPLFNYYGLTTIWLFNLSPIWGPFNFILLSYGYGLSGTELFITILSTMLWISVLYYFTKKAFVKNLLKIL